MAAPPPSPSSAVQSTGAPTVFDRMLARRRRRRALRAGVAGADFLHQRIAEDALERLSAVKRTFPRAVSWGGMGAFARAWMSDGDARAQIEWLASADANADVFGGPRAPLVSANEESAPFADDSLNLVVSVLGLQGVNDLPGALVQIRRALKPDGLFLGALFGGETLKELRECLLTAEADTGGAGWRVAPFADTFDMAGLLQRAGFALPVADRDRLTVRYSDPLSLLKDLRAMGETAVMTDRARRPLTRTTLLRMADVYQQRFADPDGKVRATFDIVWATGWAPHASQQKPLRPGSARTRLADALGVAEQSAGEKAGG